MPRLLKVPDVINAIIDLLVVQRWKLNLLLAKKYHYLGIGIELMNVRGSHL